SVIVRPLLHNLSSYTITPKVDNIPTRMSDRFNLVKDQIAEVGYPDTDT
ncbi:36074_t:CDS:1, partial [Gigaspora margarita]